MLPSPFRRSQGWTAVAPAAALLAALLAVPGDATSPGVQRGQPAPLPKVMQVKLERSQAVLKALVTADLATLEKQAVALGELTKQAEWGVLKTPEYARHSQEFLRAAEALAAAARAGDLSGATFDYATLTYRCVQCHQHVRGVRAAD
jgi:cytochrome c556